MSQKYRVFFGNQDIYGRDCPGDDERRYYVSEDNPNCPLNKFVGNISAVKKLRLVAFEALGRADHRCNELAFAFFGPASTGKTTLARLFAETVGLSFLEVGPKQFRQPEDLVREVSDLLIKDGLELSGVLVPPMIIFIDEVHALSSNVVQPLLKAVEYNDGILSVAGEDYNFHNVCWMIATTDEGRLFDAFRSRFSIVRLNYLSLKEIAHIVKMRNPEFEDEVCEKIAFYGGRMPRKVLELARLVQLSYNMFPRDILRTVEEVARDEGISSRGLSSTQEDILKILSAGPVASGRLPLMANIKKEELDRYILPEMMCKIEDRDSMICVTSKGYDLTEYGKEIAKEIK